MHASVLCFLLSHYCITIMGPYTLLSQKSNHVGRPTLTGVDTSEESLGLRVLADSLCTQASNQASFLPWTAAVCHSMGVAADIAPRAHGVLCRAVHPVVPRCTPVSAWVWVCMWWHPFMSTLTACHRLLSCRGVAAQCLHVEATWHRLPAWV